MRADQGESVLQKRAAYGQKYFNKYAKIAAAPTQPTSDADDPFFVTGKGTFEIIQKATGEGSSAGWGKHKSGAGDYLDYTKKL